MIFLIKMENTLKLYNQIFDMCFNIFNKKLEDYGTAWRVLRLTSLTDQIYIKAQRIRTLQEIKTEKRINEEQDVEFIGIVNYCLMALIQIDLGVSDNPDLNKKNAVDLFNKKFEVIRNLMIDKNHDYGEAWKNMRITSITDIIIQKILRLRQIETNSGMTKISEGIAPNYMDIANYSIFSLIKLLLLNEK